MIKGKQIYIALIFTFLIGNYNGFIALWHDQSPAPAAVFPYRVEFLPPQDQQALEAGISAETREELNMLLEDFLS